MTHAHFPIDLAHGTMGTTKRFAAAARFSFLREQETSTQHVSSHNAEARQCQAPREETENEKGQVHMRKDTSFTMLQHVILCTDRTAGAKETVHARGLIVEAGVQAAVEVIVKEQQTHSSTPCDFLPFLARILFGVGEKKATK